MQRKVHYPDHRALSRKHACLLLALLAALFLSSRLLAADADKTDSVPAKRQLVIAATNNFPPINTLDENGRLSGFARDMSSAVARAIGVEVRYIHSEFWTDVLNWLDDGTADLIHDAAYTPERESYLDFTAPIISMPEVIFVRDGQLNIRNLSSLYGRKVACVNRHITHIFLQSFKEIQCHVVNTPAEGLIALINGNVDAFVYPEQIVIYLAQHLKLAAEIKEVGEPLRVLTWSMTVKPGNTQLLDRLDEGIKTVKVSGEYERIYNKWFGKRLLSGYSSNEVFVITATAILISLLITITISLLLHTRRIRRTNQALEESEQKYRTLADKLPQSIFLKDVNSIYVSCNQRYADSLGIQPAEIVGKSDFDFHPDNAEAYQASDQIIMQSRQTHEFVESYIENGKAIFINSIKTPVFNESGELKGVLGIFWDITEQKHLKDKLAATINEYNAITATVPDIMYKLDTDGHFVWWNKSLENTLTLDTARLKDLSYLEAVVEEDEPTVIKAFQEAVENGFGEAEARLQTCNGVVTYYLNAARLLNEQGKYAGLVGSGRDISKQKESEQKQQLLQKQLLQAQKMESIGQLTGGIAHDFNNMLSVILGYTQLCISQFATDPDGKLKEYLQEVLHAGERGRDLVAEMLAFGRSTPGELKPLNGATLIKDVTRLLSSTLPSSLKIEINTTENTLPLLADAAQLHQAITNLIINAHHASGEYGKIGLTLHEMRHLKGVCSSCHQNFSGEFMEISVRDNGHGIPADQLDHIFEPFYTTKDVGKGSGMGLPMVDGILHQCGGHILVESKPDVGSNFRLLLQTAQTQDRDNNTQEFMSPTPLVADRNIMVIDDEVAITNFLTDLLSGMGYTVQVYNNPLRAIEAFKNKPDAVDLVITDQTMPDLTGGETAIQLLALRPELPIILCTGHSESMDAEKAQRLGITVFLQKPVSPDELLHTTARLLTPSKRVRNRLSPFA